MSSTSTTTATEISLRPLPSPTSAAPLERKFSAGDGPLSPDLEPAMSGERDPLLLRERVKSDDDIIEIRKRAGWKRGEQLKDFYDNQNAHIENLLKPIDLHNSEAADEADASRLKVKIAVYGSLVANILLSGLQVYAAASSLSLSFFATAADSVFDPFANLLLNWTHKKGKKLDPVKWPAGGSRLETIANICYGFLMISVNMILIVESIRTIFEGGGKDNDTNELHIPAIAAVCVAFGTKLSLFFYCMAIRKSSSQVQMLWEDHRNDLPVNGFGILTNAGGAALKWWIDPAGAMIIATGVIISWVFTCYKQFTLLAGKSAGPDFLQLVVYKAMTFNEEITQIDSCKAYHSGPDLVVEVDIVMPGDTPLHRAHDVSQALQDALEDLPGVTRSHVHVDWETDHHPEHRKKLL